MNMPNLFKGYFACLLLFCTIYFPVDAQETSKLRFTNINTHNGLPNNNVNAIVRDKRGFLWVATNDGLCRYDSPGNFKTFYASENVDLDGLKSSNISTLFIDSKDNLWIGTRLGGLSRYHLLTEEWTTFLHDPTDKSSLSHNEVLCITEDNQQNIWIGTEDGLNLYLPEKEAFMVFKENNTNPNSLSSKAVLTITVDSQGWIWVGTWNGGIHLITLPESGDLNKIQFRNVTPAKNEEAWNVWKIYQDKEQRYWVGTFGHGLSLMQLPNSATNKRNAQNWEPTFHKYIPADTGKQPISSSLIKDILQDEKGRLWIATVHGVNHILPNQLPDPKVFNKPTKKRPKILFNRHIYDPTNKYSIAHNDISNVYEDNQGLLWFGTFGGLAKHNWFTNQFSVIEIFDFQQETPNTQNMYVDNDRIAWIGAGPNGLVKYDLNSGEYWQVNKTQPNLLTSKDVYAIYSPNDRDIYIATDLGVTILNRKTGDYTKFQTPEWFTKQNTLYAIHCIYVDKYHKIWLGTGVGLFSLNPKTGKYKSYLHHPENPKSISDNSINKIMEDTYGKLWVATYNGLNVSTDYGEEVVTFQHYKANKPNSSDEKTIASNRITTLKQVQDELYIGTTNGLVGFDLIHQTFTNYSTTKGSTWIQSIESSNPTELWISTTEGIISFDILKQQFNWFEQADGLGDLTFRKGSSSIDTFGNYYFGSRQGLTVIQPSTIKKNTTLPPVYITDVEKVNAERRILTNCINRKDYTLDYDDYYLSIKFAALNYNRPEKNIYAYKLEGLEKNWTYTASTSPVVYTNLKHGTYTFRVKATNNDGLWNEAGTAIKIIKKPAFWETWWFYLASILSTLLFIFLANRYHTNNIRKRNLALEKYNQNLNMEIEERKRVEMVLKKREDLLAEQSKKLEAFNVELKRSNSDLEHFAYAASHDLKEPLRVISGFTNLLSNKYKKTQDEETAQYVYFIKDGVTRMTKLIQNLLNYAKVGKNEIQFNQTDLNKIVATKLFDLSELIKEKNASIEVGELPIIYCEKEQISMLFHNLISNAIKFNKKENRQVKILNHQDAPADYWKISVSDNGIGIKPEYQKKIFEIFQRLHAKSEFEGTGIGLALCKKIIDAHKGEIQVSSKIGVGTTFFVFLPKLSKNQYANSEEVVLNSVG